ncbi:TerD family protein [Streptomyces sp. JJ36]|uniref:TerD family protein n=1 Tax=Streptomyces sp. JJ36 TaxID=2736645 RepID=UPI001F3E463D|nr:TerD family protein [Streptomyces sp. JJ36]MCF6521873.1 TerD family protein [Streptomyces sp. JJ36]
MSGLSKGLGKVEVRLKWDPSPLGEPDDDLDIIAAVFRADDPHGTPAHLVYWDSRSPDGTITLNRDSRTGQGFGVDEAMTLEFSRMRPEHGRVVVGVAIQQNEQPDGGRKCFRDVSGTRVEIHEGYDELARDDFAGVAGCTAVTVAEFVRDASGEWALRDGLHGFDGDPESFPAFMSRPRV